MQLAAFLNAGAQGTVGWRHPNAPTSFLSASHYATMARILEDAGFDVAFVPDSLTVPRSLGDSFEPAVKWGTGTPRMDPVPVVSVMAAVTTHLGIAATASTSYNQPYSIARTFATLDHLSGGRAGWNVVTSFQDAEAQNFGSRSLDAKKDRYGRAEEFLRVVTRLWDSWDDDAVLLDKDNGVFARPDLVDEVSHQGRYYSVRGPLGVPRPPQGYPVLFQAGASDAGRDLASRWADVVFCSHESMESAQDYCRDIKERARKWGRDPEQVKILPAATVVVGEDDSDARAKHEAFARLVTPEAGLSRMAYHVNVDLTRYDLDGPLPSLEEVGVEGHYKEIMEFSRRENLTIRQIGAWYGARTEGGMVGSPVHIADTMQKWLDNKAADGFMIQPTHVPGSFREFSDKVIPELRKRGLVRTEYSGTTLRDNLGLPRPARNEWIHRAAVKTEGQ